METLSKRRAVLGVGNYTARQVKDKVLLLAEGETPTPNYKVWLQAGPEAVFPPTYELWWLPPHGPSPEIPTPFHVHTSFRVEGALAHVKVRDAEGFREVPVEQVERPEAGEGEAEADSKALVYRHQANQFSFKYKGQAINFTQANIAGDPILTYGDRDFYGREITLSLSPLGELVTVTLQAVADGDSTCFSLLLPPTWVSGYEPVAVEALVLETVHRSTIAGPPPGQEVLYEHMATVKGMARFIVS